MSLNVFSRLGLKHTEKDVSYPLVSIITPSFNQGKFIRSTIESVLSQDYPNLEYIVMDGGSTDDTLSILKEYEGRLTYISEKDSGQSNAINKGFRMARGEIVAWLNSDDVYEPGCISHAVEMLQKAPQAAMVYGEGYIIDAQGEKVKPFEWTTPFDLWALMHVQDYIMQPTTFFRARYLEEVGYLNESLNWCMDWDLWIRFAQKYDILYTDHFLACSREYGETKTSTGGAARLQEILGLMRKYTGEQFPYGYEIYYCAELLLDQELMPDHFSQYVQQRCAELLQNQPVPQKGGEFVVIANLLYRADQKKTSIVVHNTCSYDVGIYITQNGAVLRQGVVRPGKDKIQLEQVQAPAMNAIMINLPPNIAGRIEDDGGQKIRLTILGPAES